MSLTAFMGRCPHCGHDHGENTLFDVARGTLTPAQQAQVNEQFANYAKQKPHLYGGCDEITTLREQVEKLTKERDEWKNNHTTEVRRARVLKERTDMPIERVNAYEQWGKDQEQLAALAEQNEKMRKELEEIVDWTRVERVPLRELELESIARVLSLPDLASPALNRIRAEGMRMAAEIIRNSGALEDGDYVLAIRAKADELEQSDAAPSA